MRAILAAALALVLAIPAAPAADLAAAPVTVSGGAVQGGSEQGVAVFKGIPFAAPPVGPLRWKAPQPVVPWQGVKQTTQFAPACEQVQLVAPDLGFPRLKTSEDCLYLNVWTPAHSAGEKLPVMVWIYGGGFAIGASSYPVYDGTALAKKGVIVVSIAYRVGPFGFLATPGLTAESAHHSSGNYGLLDQIAALKWVRDNIAAFGGDPDKVTIFGESAGGISVSMLCQSPLAHGLFARAISESGGSFGPTKKAQEGGEMVPSLAGAEAFGSGFLKAIGAADIAAARKLPASAILKGPGTAMGTGFWPVADGYVLPRSPYDLYAQGQQNDTPVLIGTNADEGAVFVHETKPAAFREEVKAGYGAYAPSILKAYPSANEAEATQSARDLFADTAFQWPTWTWARLQSQTGHGKAYVYYFSHKAHYAPGTLFAKAGATHGSEMAYVFGTTTHNKLVTYSAADRALSKTMQSYWVNFAKNGNPNGPDLPRWPAFTNAKPVVEHIAAAPKPGAVPHLKRLHVLSGYYGWRRAQRQLDASKGER